MISWKLTNTQVTLLVEKIYNVFIHSVTLSVYNMIGSVLDAGDMSEQN